MFRRNCDSTKRSHGVLLTQIDSSPHKASIIVFGGAVKLASKSRFTESRVSDVLAFCGAEGERHKYNYAYGDTLVAAKHCGFADIPFHVNGEWQHGANMPERNCDPDLVIGSDGLSFTRKRKTYFVARLDQEKYLRSCGFKSVHSIGLPIVYVPNVAWPRIPGTLLVMPTHTLPEMSATKAEDDYVSFIDEQRSHFLSTTVCLHRNCYDNSPWRAKFEAIGMTVVRGADPDDVRSYEKLSMLFSSFENMTTNGFGSHVPYAAYFGTKVSICGPSPEYEQSDFANVPFYKNNPRMFDLIQECMKQIRKSHQYLYRMPTEATERIHWAAEVLGADNKRTPSELRKLFGWALRSRLRRKVVENFHVVMATAGNCGRSLRKRSNPGG